MLKIFLTLPILLFLLSCGGGWDDFESAISGEKKKNTDEYLIKSKDPLILPPDYKELPLPDSKNTGKEKTIESILGDNQPLKKGNKTTLEKSIEEELKKSN